MGNVGSDERIAVAEARVRRHDPGRQERIVEAALRVLARDGVVAITHRSVAREADVPLGSTTYHFASLDDLVLQAFEVHVDKLATRFERRLSAVDSIDGLVDALADAVEVDLGADAGDLALTYELYGAAVRSAGVRRLTERWMSRAEAALQRHVDLDTARLIDTVVEGLMVHRSIAGRPLRRDAVVSMLRRAIAAAPSSDA